MKRKFIVVIISFVLVLFSALNVHAVNNTVYLNVVKNTDNTVVATLTVDALDKGLDALSGKINYDKEKLEFVKIETGNEKWNKTYSIKNPQASYCGDYIVVASKNGNEIALLDSDGQMKKFSVSYPIVDLEVAKQGVIALILHGDNGNYIELYDAAQKKLVSIKVTSDQNGYPMDIDLSSDGQNLLVSYLVVDGINVKSRVALYNFGQEGEDSGDQMIGGFDFKDTVIPKVSFMGDSKAVAIGDDQMIFFKVGKTISKKQTISFDKDVSSVAVNDDYAAFVFEDQKKTDQEKYEAVVYNKTGRKLMSHKFSSEYNKLLLGEKELLLAGNYHCSIVNFAGHEMYKKDFKKRIVNISPTGKRQKYLITYENSTNLSEIY